ncbi:hypothetical protein MMC25_005806 [Agyrium rufum]|nr:hypothetical protein [Agyrium rufum]
MAPPSRISPPPSPSNASPITSEEGLTPSQLQTYNENGYLIIPSYLSPETVSALLSETSSLLHNFPLAEHPLTRFSTGESTSHVSDAYFLESHDKIRFFFEEDAFSSPETSTPSTPLGTLLKPKHLAINKIGHYIHQLSPPFRSATLTSRNAAVARSLGFRDPRVLQSMVICKQPEIGGRVPPHQDSTFLYTDPPSAVGFWIALEDATISNGCLSFWEGSHRQAEVGKRFVRGNEGMVFEDVKGERWAKDVSRWRGEEGSVEKREGMISPEEANVAEKYKLGEVKAGSLVLIHGNLLHKSEKNSSRKGRMIYTFHVIEGEEIYDAKNWLQPPEGGFTRLYKQMKT